MDLGKPILKHIGTCCLDGVLVEGCQIWDSQNIFATPKSKIEMNLEMQAHSRITVQPAIVSRRQTPIAFANFRT